MKNKKPTKKEIEEYIKFLEKAVNSKNMKQNDPDKWEKYKQKLEKEKLKLKLLFNIQFNEIHYYF